MPPKIGLYNAIQHNVKNLTGTSHSIDVWPSGYRPSAALFFSEFDELFAARIGGLNGIALLAMVADTEVPQKARETPALRIAPLLVNILQEAVDLRDLQVDLLAGQCRPFCRGEPLLPPEALCSAASGDDEERDENCDSHGRLIPRLFFESVQYHQHIQTEQAGFEPAVAQQFSPSAAWPRSWPRCPSGAGALSRGH